MDNIDLGECERRGIACFNTPDANTQAVVEYVTCLLCDALRPRLTLTEPVSAARWNEIRRDVVAHRQMDELTLGVLGFGRIGRRVAQVAAAIGFEVRFHDLVEVPEADRAGVARATLANP